MNAPARLARDLAADAFLCACRAELEAPKPGNVGLHGEGHGMSVAQFLASAEAAAPAIAAPAPIGARVLAAVRATRRVVDCNTNLGILLLAAPLLHAACELPHHPQAAAVAAVLEGLTVEDARLAYRAIRLAAPGGLGTSAHHDVAEEPEVDLRAAMAEACLRDRVARQYAAGFADVLAGSEELALLLTRLSPPLALAQVYLGYLARFGDSHIARRHGSETAERVRRQAAALYPRFASAPNAALLAPFDAALKAAGINPGTSADLSVAALLALLLREPAYRTRFYGSASRGTDIPPQPRHSHEDATEEK